MKRDDSMGARILDRGYVFGGKVGNDNEGIKGWGVG